MFNFRYLKMLIISSFLLINHNINSSYTQNISNSNITTLVEENSKNNSENNHKSKSYNSLLLSLIIISVITNIISIILIFKLTRGKFLISKYQQEIVTIINENLNSFLEEYNNEIKKIKKVLKINLNHINEIDSKVDNLITKPPKTHFNINQLTDDQLKIIDENKELKSLFYSIYSKFHDIDKKLQVLEKANQRIIISGGKSNPQPKPIPLDKDELINVYNYAPQILAEYATPVSITEATYRKQTKRRVYLEYAINGYYWVILTEDENGKTYWLLPNGDRTIKLYRLKDTIRLLFALKGSKQFRTNILTVTKLAQLEILPSGLTWLLLERGCIENKRSEIINLKKTIQKDLEEKFNIFIEEKKEDLKIEIEKIMAGLK